MCRDHEDPSENCQSVDSFWADMIQHLTDLDLRLDYEVHDAQDLESLGMFTALRELRIAPDFELGSDGDNSLEGQSVALEIPNLCSLRIKSSEQGEFVLSCPKLSYISVHYGVSLHKKVEKAALRDLWLASNQDVRLDLPALQLESLHCLDPTF